MYKSIGEFKNACFALFDFAASEVIDVVAPGNTRPDDHSPACFWVEISGPATLVASYSMDDDGWMFVTPR